ncbi:MAG: hypothetical protein ACO3IM_05700 [Pelagibacteraceae bacterium]
MKYELHKDYLIVMIGNENEIKKYLLKNKLIRCLDMWQEMTHNVSVGIKANRYWLRKVK